jgi:hypothetical protein
VILRYHFVDERTEQKQLVLSVRLPPVYQTGFVIENIVLAIVASRVQFLTELVPFLLDANRFRVQFSLARDCA